MDPVTNPYTPGAGTPPPELAGRDELRETVRVATERTRAGRAAKSVLLVGLRGVGKTVLRDRTREDAEAAGMQTLRIETPEGRRLPAMNSRPARCSASSWQPRLRSPSKTSSGLRVRPSRRWTKAFSACGSTG